MNSTQWIIGMLLMFSVINSVSATEMPVVWARNTTQGPCETGGGTWTSLSKDDNGALSTTDGICRCDLVGDIPIQKWTGTECMAWTTEEACIYSFGQWTGTTCVCDTVNGVYEWSNNTPFCVGIGGVPSGNDDIVGGTAPSRPSASTASTSSPWIIGLLVVGVIIVIATRKRRRK